MSARCFGFRESGKSFAFNVLGVSLLVANWFLFVSGILALLMIIWRTRIEEAQLTQRSCDDYRNYVAPTGKFLPRIRATR